MDIKNNRKSNGILNGKKGFTLVELIVVLVIVVILAALIVPGILGMIDNAKEKEVISHAQTALSATQASLSDIYSSNDNKFTLNKRNEAKIKAGAGDDTEFTVWNVCTLYDERVGNKAPTMSVTDEIGSYTVGKAIFREGNLYAAYDGSNWTVYDTEEEARTTLAVTDEKEKGVIYVWKYGGEPLDTFPDYALMEDKIVADIDTHDVDETVDPEVETRIVVLKLDETNKLFFASSADGPALEARSVTVKFTKNSSGKITCSAWTTEMVGEENMNKFTVSDGSYYLRWKNGFRLGNWKDEKSDNTAVNAVGMGILLFSDPIYEDMDKIVFVAQVIIEPGDNVATVGRDKFDGFLASVVDNNHTIASVTRIPANTYITEDEPIDWEVFESNHPGWFRIDDEDTKCRIYAWMDGTALNWWTDAETAYLMEDCSNVFKAKEPNHSAGTLKNVAGSAGANLVAFDFTGFDMYKVKTMAGMFQGCDKLTGVTFGDDFVAPELEDMSSMFAYAENITAVDFSSIKTVGPTINLDSLFCNLILESFSDPLYAGQEFAKLKDDVRTGNSKLSSVTFGDCFKNTKITECKLAFAGCKSLATIDVSDWNETGIESTYGLFSWCSGLQNVIFGKNDADLWNLENCSDISFMFYTCKGMTDGSCLSKFKTSKKLTTLNNTFCRLEKVKSIDCSNIDPTNVWDFQSTFKECQELEYLNLSKWKKEYNKAPKSIKSLKQTFWDCKKLKNLDMGGWDVTKLNPYDDKHSDLTNYLNDVTFRNVTSLTYLDLSGWNPGGGWSMPTSFIKNSTKLTEVDLSGAVFNKVENLSYLFSNHKVLTKVNMNGFSAPSATTLAGMFNGCQALEDLDLTGVTFGSLTTPFSPEQLAEKNWVLSTVTDIHEMFKGCSKLPSLDVSGWNVSAVTDMHDLFNGCSGLEELNVSGWNVSAVTDMHGLFSGCSGLEALNVSGWNVSAVKDMHDLFKGCSKLTTLSVSGWNVSEVTNISNLFSGCTSLATIDASGWNVSKVISLDGLFSGCEALTSLNLDNWNLTSVTSLIGLFSGCKNLSNLSLVGWDKINVTSLNSLFKDCNKLSSLDLTGWNTESVTDFGSMFSGCSELDNLTLDDGFVSAATDISSMFSGCEKLTTVNTNGWDVSAVTKLDKLFYGCKALNNVDVSAWNTSNVQSSKGVFQDCSSLTNVDVSGWNLSNSTDISYFFAGCASLTGAVVSSWKPEKAEYAGYVFNGCSSMTSVVVDGWKLNSIPNEKDRFSGFFGGCSSLTSISMRGLYVPSTWKIGNAFFDAASNSLKTITLTNSEFTVTDECNEFFKGFKKLETADLSGLTINIKSGGSMYRFLNECTSLKTADLSGMVINGAGDVGGIFNTCTSLTTVKLNGMKLNGANNTSKMFLNCKSLSKITLPDWTAVQITNTSNMFNGCTMLTEVDISGIDLSRVNNCLDMFTGCKELETIYTASNLNNAGLNKSTSTFSGCSKLSGKNGASSFAYATNSDTANNNRDKAKYGLIFENGSVDGYFTNVTEKQ